MRLQPDVLDHLGKTPREFGAVHAHLEAAHRNAHGEAEAVVLFQAAFSPAGEGTISFHASEAGPPLLRHPLPRLDDARVFRVRYPLVLEGSPGLLYARIESERPARGERIRPAWLLADTIEVPKQGLLDDIAAVERFEGRNHRGSYFSDDLQKLRRAARVEVHRARRLPPMLHVEFTPPRRAIAREFEVELVWKVGDPLPDAPEIGAPNGLPMTMQFRRCFACTFDGSMEKYGDALSCPMCGEPWP